MPRVEAPARGRARRGGQELLVDDGPVTFIRTGGRVLLRQGAVAIDVTAVLVQENYPGGRVTLRVRRSPDANVTVVANEPEPSEAPAATLADELLGAGET